MARIWVTSSEEYHGGVFSVRVEVTEDQGDGTGMWDCESCNDGAMRPNLNEAIADAQVHVDHQCREREKSGEVT